MESYILFTVACFLVLGRTIDDLQNYFQGVVGSPGRESVIFCSKRGLEMLSRQDTLAGDGTFYMAPDIDGVKQIWILSAFKHGKVRQLGGEFPYKWNIPCPFSFKLLSLHVGFHVI